MEINNPFNFPVSRIVDLNQGKLPYSPSSSYTFDSPRLRKSLHFGQRKLLLSEIEYLSGIRRIYGDIDHVIVYAGAAGGMHLPKLFSLFPRFKFILIDPAPFCNSVLNLPRGSEYSILELVNEYCTENLCKGLKERYNDKKIFLISDIRSGSPSSDPDKYIEIITRDHLLQESFCWTLEACAAMLKFHPPYPFDCLSNSEISSLNDSAEQCIEYLDGTCLYGVWGPKSSSEVRLITKGPFVKEFSAPRKLYNRIDHEMHLSFYNANRYSRDIQAEYNIISTYLDSDDSERIRMFSNDLSSGCLCGFFTPLSVSEDDGRLQTLLYRLKREDRDYLYKLLRGRLTMDSVYDLMNEIQKKKSLVPRTSLITLPDRFWDLVKLVDISIVYSTPGVVIKNKRN